MKITARQVAGEMIEAFLNGTTLDGILDKAPPELAGLANDHARIAAERINYHARRYTAAPTPATWAEIPQKLQPMVKRYIDSRRKP